MTNKFAAIRAALDAGPTPGPWRAEMVYDAGYAHINFDSREWNTLRGFCGEANAAHIVACDPDTIRALLAERDALRAAAARQAENIERWMETGIPADAEESKSIYEQLKAALTQGEAWPAFQQ